MNDEKVREDFEDWYAIHTAGWPPGIANSECCKDVMWQPWKASRADVVVELPEIRNVPDRDCWARTNALGYNTSNQECRQAIEAAGLKVR